MTIREQILNKFIMELCRLKRWNYPLPEKNLNEFKDIAFDLIYNQLPEEQITPFLIKDGGKFIESNFKTYLNEEDIFLIQTVKITTVMELSEDWKILQENIKKLKPQEIKLVTKQDLESDFDKILKGIMKVPKPKK